MPLRWDARTDKNQQKIIDALRDAHCSVLPLHRLGQGAPDLAVGRMGNTYFLEIKSDKGKLTKAEKEFIDLWRGHYAIVRNVGEALKAVGIRDWW